MQGLQIALQLYFTQKDAIYTLCLYVIISILLTCMVIYIIFTYNKVKQLMTALYYYKFLLLIGFFIYLAVKCSYLCTPIHTIMSHIKVEEQTLYYSLHFNPTEPIAFDDNGGVYRLNGNEPLLPITEEMAETMNHIKVKQVAAQLDSELVVRLNLNRKKDQPSLQETYIFSMNIIDTQYQGTE